MKADTAIKGKESIKLMLVRPPGHLWPIINESDNYLMPLGLPALAAYLRREMKNIEIKIVDCLPEKIGWKSLAKIIEEYQPDVFGVGDMVIYVHEGTRALKLAKEIKPDVVNIAGGHFHSHMPDYSLTNFPYLDYIVRYEGEVTTTELLETLMDGGDLSQVKSISYRDGDKVVNTDFRQQIEDLDTLPLPAYDLMPIDKYSPFGLLWPRAITIQGSRGCPYNCNYCAWTAMEGQHEKDKNGNAKLVPSYRRRSAARVLEEIDFLYNNYGIRYLFWAEGTWNQDDDWLDELCTGIIERGYKLGWWAFVRADRLLEQEEIGLLPKMVRAGLRHVLMGGERSTDEELNEVGKNTLKADALIKASHLLKRKYPQVFRQTTFLTGIRSETPAALEALGRYSRSAKLDFAAYHPITPFPGTALYYEAVENDWIEEKDFAKFDMFFPVMSSETMSREEISHHTQNLYQHFVIKQPLAYLAGMFSPHKIRRRLKWWFLFSIGRVIFNDLILSLRGKKQFEGFGAVSKLWKPTWYDD
jgi:anaerobic magnesium-protoporphyrin IX monomethyl ester cyclase